MRSILRYLKNNWFKYGFETAAILVGILGAFALSTWHETRKENELEKEYLINLLVDLEGHLDNIENQLQFVGNVQQTCEEILSIIEQPPYDVPAINSLVMKVNRRSFVNSSPVFEDLKYSGNLAIISISGLRQSIFNYYQHVDYLETVIASNNASYADKISFHLVNMAIGDLGSIKSVTTGLDLDFSLEVEPFSGSTGLIDSKLRNTEIRFNLHNMMILRGRICSIEAQLLNELNAETQQLIDKLEEVLKK